MTNVERMKIVLDSVQSVKSKASSALKEGNFDSHVKLMFDLWALQACLVGECEILVREESRIKLAA